MKLSIFKKIMALSVLIAVSMSCIIFATAMYFMFHGFDEESRDRVSAARETVSHFIEVTQKKFHEQALLIADNEAFVRAVAEGDVAELRRLSAQTMKSINADFVTVSDAQGKALAHGHSDQRDDSLSDQGAVRKALKGEATAGIVSGNVMPFSIRASAPILQRGRVIGTLSAGISLTEEKFVDRLKEYLGVEITVFKGDMRIATTLVNAAGKRAVGTKIDNQSVIRTVLNDSQTFIDKNTIMGKEYETAYWPIKDLDGNNSGMWFVGVPLEKAAQILSTATYSTLGLICLTLPLFLGLSFLLARAISKPLSMATDYASELVAGRLDGVLEVKSRDEVGVLADALRAMVRSLREKIAEATRQSELAAGETLKAQEALAIAENRQQASQVRQEAMLRAVEQLQEVVGSVSDVSEQLAAKIDETLQGAELQNGRMNETAGAMEQMNEAVLDITRSASHASEVSVSARSRAVDGEKIVGAITEAIALVNAKSEALSRDMDALGVRAEEIGRILGVISDIADQTNLLALNAAIEAARAGEAGRGFAVVADEVRKLAEKTMAATKEVGDAISGIQKGTRDNIAQLAEAVGAVEGVTRKAEEAGTTLRDIVSFSDSVSAQVSGIAAASEEGSAVSEQIRRSVSEVSVISGEIRTGMHASSEEVGNLTAQTQKLRNVITQLQKAMA